MKPERIHLLIGLVWLIAGMVLGEHMGRTTDHGQAPTHAHIMLVGGVLPILWAVIYRLFIGAQGLLAWIQTIVHHLGTVIMIVALYMYYGAYGTLETLGPVLGVSAVLLILAAVLMLALTLRAKSSD